MRMAAVRTKHAYTRLYIFAGASESGFDSLTLWILSSQPEASKPGQSVTD